MKSLNRMDKWGGSNYFNVEQVRQFVREWAAKVEDEKRRAWFINTVGSYLLANLGLTYHQKCPLPELPTRPSHETATAVALVAWEAEVEKVRALRQSEACIHAAQHGFPVDICWAHPLQGRYLSAVIERRKEAPTWLINCVAEGKPVHAFMAGPDLEEVLDEVVQVLNSPLPEMRRLTYRQFDQMVNFVRNVDLKRRLGHISREEATARLKKDASGLKALGLRRIMDFPDGHYWVQLVPTPDELVGGVVGFTACGTETRTSYRSVLDECNAMSNGQGVAHFCIANGVYDAYLEGGGMILSLRDAQNRPHVTVAIRADGSIDQLQGRCNTTPKSAYFKHIWAVAERFPLKAAESSGSQAKNVGLVSVAGRFVPVAKLSLGATVAGDLTLRGYSDPIELPAELVVEGSLDLTDTVLERLPERLTVRADCNLARTQLTQLPRGLKVGRRLNITMNSITSLPPDLEAGDLLCDRIVPEAQVRNFLFHTKIDTIVKPKFKRAALGLGDTVDAVQVEKQWKAKLAYHEGLWSARLPGFRKTFMTSKTGNIALLVNQVYGGKVGA